MVTCPHLLIHPHGSMDICALDDTVIGWHCLKDSQGLKQLLVSESLS